MAGRLSAWMIAFPERPLPVESSGTFHSLARGGEPASRAASLLPVQSRRTAARPGSVPAGLGMLLSEPVRPAGSAGAGRGFIANSFIGDQATVYAARISRSG